MFSAQLKELFYFCLTGFEISFLFDIFRAKRRAIKTKDFITCIEDIFFWCLSGVIIIFTIIRYTDGDIRSYMTIGLVFGIVIYYRFMSKIILTILIKLFNIILFPIKKIIN